MSAKKISLYLPDYPFLWTLLVLSVVWLRSGLEKLIGGEFVKTLPIVLGYFASNNPYFWYKSYLLHSAVPNSQMIGNLVMFGEVYSGLVILIGASYLIIKRQANVLVNILIFTGCIVGMLLNANFWLASGWTSPASDGLNSLMFLIELIGAIYFAKFIIVKYQYGKNR